MIDWLFFCKCNVDNVMFVGCHISKVGGIGLVPPLLSPS